MAQNRPEVRLLPASPTLFPGQATRFALNNPWGGTVTWEVQPATGGVIDPNGLFLAGTTPGSYQVIATLAGFSRLTVATPVTVLPPPPPTSITADQVQGSSAPAQKAGAMENAALPGAAFPAVTATDPSGQLSLRHGFKPPGGG